jgi:hypothetical protein
MSNRLFTYNTVIDSIGIKGGGFDEFFDISGIDKIRIVTENGGTSNEMTFRVKIKGQSTPTVIGTLVGNGNKVFDVKTYDEFQIECTVYNSALVNFSSTGFKLGAGAVQQYNDVSDLPDASGSSDLVWVVSEASLYYDEPSSGTWVAQTGSGGGGSVVLPNTRVAFGSAINEVSSKNNFTFDSNTDTLTVPNITVSGNSLLNSLYKPEAVYTLSGTDITNKYITLSTSPTTANKTRFYVEGGPEQIYGIDFTVSGNELSWNGLTLDGILESGDRVVVTFN